MDTEKSNVEQTEQKLQEQEASKTLNQDSQDKQTQASETAEQNNTETLDELIAQYFSMTREELTKELEKQLEKADFEELRVRVPLIRNAFAAIEKPVQEPKTEQTAEQQEDTKAEENNTEKEQNTVDAIEKNFYDLYDKYKQKRQQYLEEQEQQKQKNLEKKQALLNELRVLLESEKTLKEIYDSFNQIQQTWKEVGNVPHSEVNNLWESYHFLMEKFYEKVKINRELRDLGLKKNLEDKLALCEKAEELLLSDDINMSFQILQEYHRQWKQIGAVPSDKNDEIWQRFQKASEAINTRRREYYEKRVDELENNLKQKQELLEEAIEVNSHKRDKHSHWNEDTEKMNALVEKWKTVGPVPRQYNDDIWNKFKAQKDGFFDARKEFFAHAKQVEEENYNKKLALCERVEAIVNRTDFDQATKDILALQEEWKQIGFVRKSLSDKIWLRFRAACDEFFKRKSEEFMRTHQEVEENIKKKEQLIEELSSYEFTDNKVENVSVLKDFQKRWFEIGFTPKQERQKLQKKWNDIIEANKEKLQITAQEIAQRGSRFLDSVSQMAQGGKKAINNRIANLEKQIDSLENNIGFLSGSKNADILKKEFEHKIYRLKEERINLLNHLKDIKLDKPQEEVADNKQDNTSDNEIKENLN